MQKIHLTTVNKKTISPVTLTVIQTFATWLIPSMYGHQVSTTIQHTFTNQVILILFVFMFNFLIFDRFTNKMPIPIFLGMTGISILVVAFSFFEHCTHNWATAFTCLLSLLLFLFQRKTTGLAGFCSQLVPCSFFQKHSSMFNVGFYQQIS